MDAADKFVGRSDTSAASRADSLFKRTGKRTSPYLRHPERETYSETETYERPDGTRYERTRTVHRWAGSFSFGAWVVESA